MAKFVKVAVFTTDTFILSDFIYINPDNIVGMNEVIHKKLGSTEFKRFTKFWTVDGKEYYSPLDIVKFHELIS